MEPLVKLIVGIAALFGGGFLGVFIGMSITDVLGGNDGAHAVGFLVGLVIFILATRWIFKWAYRTKPANVTDE